jgi:hypothetical protein
MFHLFRKIKFNQIFAYKNNKGGYGHFLIQFERDKSKLREGDVLPISAALILREKTEIF